MAIVVGRYRGEGLRGGVEAEGRTDPATGQPIRPCLVRLLLDREVFESVALDEPRLDPVQCLEHLKARLSENAEAGRITLIDGARRPALIKERLGRDTMISARRTAP